MRSKAFLIALVLACAPAMQASALPFSAGDLIVTTADEILELAGLSSEVVDRLALAGQIQPCFLPNGNLIVVGPTNNLFEITPDGEVVREIDVDISDTRILGVLVGPNGAVYVRVESQLLRIDLATGNVESAIELAGAQEP